MSSEGAAGGQQPVSIRDDEEEINHILLQDLAVSSA